MHPRNRTRTRVMYHEAALETGILEEGERA